MVPDKVLTEDRQTPGLPERLTGSHVRSMGHGGLQWVNLWHLDSMMPAVWAWICDDPKARDDVLPGPQRYAKSLLVELFFEVLGSR